jgi:hypothetical protein
MVLILFSLPVKSVHFVRVNHAPLNCRNAAQLGAKTFIFQHATSQIEQNDAFAPPVFNDRGDAQ